MVQENPGALMDSLVADLGKPKLESLIGEVGPILVALAEVLEPHDSQDREGALDYRVSYANFLYGFDDNGSIRALKLS
jgi:hypothetical protein